MNTGSPTVHRDLKLERTLVLDELADLTLYEKLLPHAQGELATLLRTLIPIERAHFEFWKQFFGMEDVQLSIGRRVRLALLVLLCRVFGASAIGLTLEAIEVHGIKKYLKVWDMYRATPLGEAVRTILNDEFGHEDAIISKNVTGRVRPERVRDIFLGLNDGLVEMIGAISGFFAAFQGGAEVFIAAFTVSIAGAMSMAAGVFMGTSSAREMEDIEDGRKRFLGEPVEAVPPARPVAAAVAVGISYLLGSLVPISPLLFGARSLYLSVGVSAVAVVLVSYALAFLSGMAPVRRALMNLGIAGAAVIIAYGIGTLANQLVLG